MQTHVRDDIGERGPGSLQGGIIAAVRETLAGLPPVIHAGPLYTAEERSRRDKSRWTTVQAILAPLQFLIFFVSLVLVTRVLVSGDGAAVASVSVVAKTFALYAIMITGALWEKDVYGRWLFARAFFWEDVFSMLVIGLHTAYLAALLTGALSLRGQMLLALAAYASYLVNATQFVLKLRAARRYPPARPLTERPA